MGCKGWIGSHTCIKDAAEVAAQLLNIFGSPARSAESGPFLVDRRCPRDWSDTGPARRSLPVREAVGCATSCSAP